MPSLYEHMNPLDSHSEDESLRAEAWLGSIFGPKAMRFMEPMDIGCGFLRRVGSVYPIVERGSSEG